MVEQPFPAGDRAAVAKLPSPATVKIGPLIAAAERAVVVLADRRGLTLSAKSASQSHRWRDRLTFVNTSDPAALDEQQDDPDRLAQEVARLPPDHEPGVNRGGSHSPSAPPPASSSARKSRPV